MLTVTDEFANELLLTDEGAHLRLDFVDCEGRVLRLVVEREDMRRVLGEAQNGELGEVTYPDGDGMQLAECTLELEGGPAYKMVMWDRELDARGEVLTFYPRRIDFDLLVF